MTTLHSRLAGRRWSLAGAAQLAFAFSLLAPTPVAAQDTSRLQGVVAEEGTGRLVPSAVVTLVGTSVQTRSGPDGAFAFTEVPMGRLLVRAQAPGYPAVVEEVTVRPDAVVFVQMLLPNTTAFLSELFVAGTREPETVGGLGDKTAADLIARHVPNVQGFTESYNSARGRAFNPSVQLRGQSSFTSAQEPVIVLDGTRITGGVGRAMDVLRQIPASQIKGIEMLRGPSAAHLYGAAGGVISIQTVSGWP